MDANVNGIMPVMDMGGHGYGDGFGYGGGWFMWILILFVLMGGNGWNNRDSNVARIQDVYASNDNQTLNANIRDLNNSMFKLGNGISDATFSLTNNINAGFNNIGRDVVNGTYVIDKAITDTRYMLGNAINEGRFAQQQCCCETNRNIDAVRYENAMNTNAITKAIADDGEKTRALLVANQMQDLRDKLADRDRDLQTAQFVLSQQAQNNTIINAVRPFPTPAYVVGSPYGTNAVNVCPCASYNA